MSSKLEHIIRVTADRLRGEGEPLVHEYTVTEVVKAAYNWGRTDGRAAAEGKPLFGTDAEWTVVSVPLSELRATFEPRVPDTAAELTEEGTGG